MAINRYELVTRHNPILTKADESSPLSVGNGNFAYTADITGMQTLYKEYETVLPLCTMAQWGWHTRPAGEKRYAYDPSEVELTEYPYLDRTVRLAVQRKPGNEEVYDWLRQNPHKFNLARIGLVLNEEEISSGQIADIRQELNLFEGILDSRFAINGVACHVETAVAGETDAVGFRIRSGLLKEGLGAAISFPYGSHRISGSDWNMEDAHLSEIMEADGRRVVIRRTLDRDVYEVIVSLAGAEWKQSGKHRFVISAESTDEIGIVVKFSSCGHGAATGSGGSEMSVSQVFNAGRAYLKAFWEKGGVVDLHKSRDTRALELERRIILSQYLLSIQSSGSVPPAETGLTCNSWYGKAHLEMYLWHEAYLPLWNHTELLERSLGWYLEHLPQARQNAAKNGFKGARWPKMVAFDAGDSPSNIATLLIWQQPHIIYMLELAYQNRMSQEFLEQYYPLIEETAEFMVDFAVYDEKTGVYDLLRPLIPVQENHAPMDTKNPAFEVEYWRFTLTIAASWAKRLHREVPGKWLHVAEHMAPMAAEDGCYLAHENCRDTFGKYAKDHPSMLCSFGLIDSGRTDKEIMANTLKRVQKVWDYPTLWGWDFAVMCMTAVRLGDPEYALELLLMESYKNCYVASGNNFQMGRPDLPLYLPGNGSLLLALPLMTAGYPGSGPLPGFPKNGMWEVEYEDIMPFPY